MTNLRNPESTMMNAHADLQAVFFSRSGDLREKDPGVGCPDFWYKEESACDRDIKKIQGPQQHKLGYVKFTNETDIRPLHDMYCRIIPAFGRLWDESIENHLKPLSAVERKALGWREQTKDWNSIGQWYDMWKLFRASYRRGMPGMLGDREPEDSEIAMARQGIEPGAHYYRTMKVGKVQFEAKAPEGGSWVLSRPPLQRVVNGHVLIERPDFGQIINIYVHVGPDGVSRVITRMKWYKRSREMYHPTLRCPLVSTEEDKRSRDVMWCAKDIVPWTCLGMPDLHVGGRQVMLARSWCILRHLDFPQQAHLYPYPDLDPVVPDVVDPEPVAVVVAVVVAQVEEEAEEQLDTDDYDRENEGYVAGGASEVDDPGLDDDDPID